jgi:hypothetical protein
VIIEFSSFDFYLFYYWQVYAKARAEFLSALEEEMDKWVETPDEAKCVSLSLSLSLSFSLSLSLSLSLSFTLC